MNASSRRDATSVMANVERVEKTRITAPFENVPETNNTLLVFNTNDETRNNIPGEVCELSVSGTHFDQQPHAHHSVLSLWQIQNDFNLLYSVNNAVSFLISSTEHFEEVVFLTVNVLGRYRQQICKRDLTTTGINYYGGRMIFSPARVETRNKILFSNLYAQTCILVKTPFIQCFTMVRVSCSTFMLVIFLR